jgi:hypothetical protein
VTFGMSRWMIQRGSGRNWAVLEAARCLFSQTSSEFDQVRSGSIDMVAHPGVLAKMYALRL